MFKVLLYSILKVYLDLQHFCYHTVIPLKHDLYFNPKSSGKFYGARCKRIII